MSDIERTDLEEVEPVAEVKQQKKKRVLTQAQKDAISLNLAKGREKLKEVHLQKQVKRAENLEEKIIKKEKSSAKSKSAEEKRIDLALQALDLVRNKTDNIDSGNDEVSPKPTPRKKQVKKQEESDETEIEEIFVKKPKKKKTILYMDNETETETDIEPVKQKRSYRKRAEQRKTEIEPISAPTPIPQQPQIIFY